MSVKDYFKRRFKGRTTTKLKPVTLNAILIESAIDRDSILVFGVNYAPPIGAGSREQELRKFSSEHRATHSAIVTSRSGGSAKHQMLAVAKFSGQRGKRYIAATAALSIGYDTGSVAFVVEVQTGSYVAWVSDQNRLPVPKSEIVGDIEEILQQVKSWKQLQTCDAIALTGGDDSALTELKRIAAVKEVDLFATQADTTTTLTPVSSQLPKYIVGAIGVCILAWQGYLFLQKKYVALQSKSTAQETRQQSVATFSNAVKDNIAASWGGHATQQYYDTIKPILEQTQFRREGWFLTQLECSMQSKTCEQSWTRSTGTYQGLIPTQASTTVRISEDFMRSTVAVQFDTANTLNNSPFPDANLPSTQANLTVMGDLFAILSAAGVSVQNITAPAPIAVYVGQAPVPEAPRKGTWIIASTPIALLNSLVTLPSNSTIQKFKISAGQSGPTTFDAQGEYFVND